MDTPNCFGYSGTGELEGQYKDTDHRKVTAQGSRYIGDTSWPSTARGNQTATLEAIGHRPKEYRTGKVENRIIGWMDNENRCWSHPTNIQPQLLKSPNRAFPGAAVRKELHDKEENEKLKKRIKTLEARYAELLSKAMAMHKDSEDMNDPSRLSAVLRRYKMLQLQEWEKVRTSKSHGWTYKQGCCIIKKLFDACEKDIQQRTATIFEVLGISPWNPAMTNSKQGIMREIRNLFGQPYYQNYSEVYQKIIREADISTETDIQRQFLLQCCQIYCLLLLQDQPVKAEWNIHEISTEDLVHVDRKDEVYWEKPELLWPIMKSGGKTVVKGVVCDESGVTSESCHPLTWPKEDETDAMQ